jgi:hypothetical protein
MARAWDCRAMFSARHPRAVIATLMLAAALTITASAQAATPSVYVTNARACMP